MYPLSETSIAKKIKADYEHSNSLRKAEKCLNKVKSDEWYKHASDFNLKLTENAYNIRCVDMTYQKQMEEQYDVTMTPDDEAFYKHNCFGTYKAVCTSTVPKVWSKTKKRKETMQRSAENTRLTTHQEDREQLEIEC